MSVLQTAFKKNSNWDSSSELDSSVNYDVCDLTPLEESTVH